jgi:hypothetical protein
MKDSLPSSQEHATRPCFESDESSEYAPIQFLKDTFDITLPYTSGHSKWPLSFKTPNQISLYIYLLFLATYTLRPFHLTLFHDSYNIRRGVEVIKLLTVQFSPVSSCFLPSRHKLSPLHPVLKHATFT